MLSKVKNYLWNPSMLKQQVIHWSCKLTANIQMLNIPGSVLLGANCVTLFRDGSVSENCYNYH